MEIKRNSVVQNYLFNYMIYDTNINFRVKLNNSPIPVVCVDGPDVQM